MTFYAVLDTTGVVDLMDLTIDTDYDWGTPNDEDPY